MIFVVGIFGFFVSCEIVDGYLYMVYDFGVGVKCVWFFLSIVNDG